MVTVQSTVDTGHEDMVHDAQMDYYGTRLATCSSDRTIRIFQVQEGKTRGHLADLRGHEGPVWQVAWGPPSLGSVIASCSYDRRVILWKEDESSSWSKIHEYCNHDSSVNSVSWGGTRETPSLVCGSSDGSVSILTASPSSPSSWEAEKINNAHNIGCNAVSWAPNNATRFVTGGCDNLIKTWRYSSEDSRYVEESILEGHSDWVRDVAWAPSLGLSRSVIASCSQDRRVIIWTSASEDSSGIWTPKTMHTFDDVVWHVSWSISGNLLAVSSGNNKVSLWKESLEGEWVCISDVHKNASSQG
eukprot:TRINITY_DN3290_c0_g1_i1.p1 TRINITY_DN3290_c0_g1~~TRINITY_DN3290_c0_g1_i1.p1  ORF type:complete len:328 (-),score=88.70 TRINITY_DN3290_c0_g1_i1:81-986(-)